jgi:hypothetical protein
MNRNYKPVSGLDRYRENIIVAFFASSVLEIYRQWVADGRNIPIDELIKTASHLICHGVAGLRKR